MSRLTKAGQWMCESLNEMAALHWQGKPYPRHTPSSPRWWFAGIVRETGWIEPPESVRENLTPGALRLWKSITRAS